MSRHTVRVIPHDQVFVGTGLSPIGA